MKISKRASRRQKIVAAQRYRKLGLTKKWDKNFRQSMYSTQVMSTLIGKKKVS